jgi:transcriptional regulator with XRE-family HTH domain
MPMNQESYNLHICNLIKEIRVQKRIKQEVLAKAISKNQGTLSRLETGTISISMEDLKLICDQLEISMIQILARAEVKMGTCTNNNNLSYGQILATLIAYLEDVCPSKISKEEVLLEAFAYIQNKINSLEQV